MGYRARSVKGQLQIRLRLERIERIGKFRIAQLVNISSSTHTIRLRGNALLFADDMSMLEQGNG